MQKQFNEQNSGRQSVGTFRFNLRNNAPISLEIICTYLFHCGLEAGL